MAGTTKRGLRLLVGPVLLASVLALLPARSAAASPQQGIDVSSYQGNINWQSVGGAGISFAYIRATFGSGVSDVNFTSNWQGAVAARITPGAYMYFVPSDDPNAQANLFLQQLKSVKLTAGDIVPAIDVEETDGKSTSTIASELQTVVTDVRATLGAAPAIYTSPVWWNDYVGSSNFTSDPLWVANWCGSCTNPSVPANNWGGNGYQVWQYSDSGSVSGISGAVDLDRGNPGLPWYGGPPPASLGSAPLGSTPHPVSWSRGEMDVFWRGTDNALWHSSYTTQNGWQGPQSLGGHLASDPYPVATQAGVLDIFWKGSDSNLWHKWFVQGAGWGGPESLGMGLLGSDPQPVSWGNGRVDVFWKGKDANIWHAYYNSTLWQGPEFLGDGPLASKPHTVSWGSNRIDLFWKGTDSNLWHADYDGTSWHGPGYLGGGPLASEPFAASDAPNIIDVFWRGTDNGIWHTYYFYGAWYPVQSLTSGYDNVNSDPSPVSIAASRYALFWVGADHQLWFITYGSGWTRPTFDGAGPVPGQAMIASQGAGDMSVFWRGADLALWTKEATQPS